MAKLKFIDLFAGLGGFHLALEKLGCECDLMTKKEEETFSIKYGKYWNAKNQNLCFLKMYQI